jgi:transposase
MRTEGSPAILEFRRRLAVRRVEDGYSIAEVADVLGVDPRSVRRWVAAFRRQGIAGLAAHPVSGRPPKLTPAPETIVGRWLDDDPTQHGFTTELWTGPRLALLIEQEFGIRFYPDYLAAWLRRRGYTPQKPRRVHRERDDEAIAEWLSRDWPRIKKRRAGGAPTSS